MDCRVCGGVFQRGWVVVVVGLAIGCCVVGEAFFRRRAVSGTCSNQLRHNSHGNSFPWVDNLKGLEREIVPRENVYIPRIGMESKVAYYGNQRELSLQELMLAFQLFPGLANATQQALWPDDRNFTESENVLSAIAFKHTNNSVWRNGHKSPKSQLNEVRRELLSWRSFLDETLNSTAGVLLSDAEIYVRALKFNKVARLLLGTDVMDQEVFTFISPHKNLRCSSYIKKSRSLQKFIDQSQRNSSSNSSLSLNTSSMLTVNATALWIDILHSFFDFQNPGYRPSFGNSSDLNNSLLTPQINYKQPLLSTLTSHEVRDMLLNILRLVLSRIKSFFSEKISDSNKKGHSLLNIPHFDILYPSSHRLAAIDDYRKFFPSVVMVELSCMIDFGLQSDDSIEEMFDRENEIILRIIP